MRRTNWRKVLLLAMLLVGLGAFMAVRTTVLAAKSTKYTVKLTGSHGEDAGKATFSQKSPEAPVKVKIELQNLPFGPHGVHIHEHAVCDAPDFHGAGGHFNPDGKQHGFNNPNGHHNGDMPLNVDVGEDHTGSATFLLTRVSLDPAAADSLFANGGTSVVVHEHGDDGKTDPSGNSGNRIACGVIKAPGQ